MGRSRRENVFPRIGARAAGLLLAAAASPYYDFISFVSAVVFGTMMQEVVAADISLVVFPLCCWDPAQARFNAASGLWGALVTCLLLYVGQWHVKRAQQREELAARENGRDFQTKVLAAEAAAATEAERFCIAHTQALEEQSKAITAQAIAQDAMRRAQQILPSETFIEQFALRSADLQRTLLSVLLLESDEAALVAAIQGLLVTVSYMASIYGSSGDVICRSLVMQFVSDPSDSEMAMLTPSLSYLPTSDCGGILVTDSRMHANMLGDASDIASTFALCLPRRDESRVDVPSGPQLAFHRAEVSGIASVRDYEAVPRVAENSLTQSFAQFLQDDRCPFSGSLIAVPLQVPSEGRDTPTKIGVLVVYSSRANIMGGDYDRWRMYSLAMRPFVDAISIIARLLWDKQNDEAATHQVEE